MSPLGTFIGITVFFISSPFLCLSILCMWKKAKKNRTFPMYTWEFFLLWQVTCLFRSITVIYIQLHKRYVLMASLGARFFMSTQSTRWSSQGSLNFDIYSSSSFLLFSIEQFQSALVISTSAGSFNQRQLKLFNFLLSWLNWLR